MNDDRGPVPADVRNGGWALIVSAAMLAQAPVVVVAVIVADALRRMPAALVAQSVVFNGWLALIPAVPILLAAAALILLGIRFIRGDDDAPGVVGFLAIGAGIPLGLISALFLVGGLFGPSGPPLMLRVMATAGGFGLGAALAAVQAGWWLLSGRQEYLSWRRPLVRRPSGR